MQQFSNRTINVKREELLSHLRSNRAKHIVDFKEAWEAYVNKWIETVEKMVDRVARGGKPELHVNLVEPKSYAADYDLIIEMLEMSTDDVIEVTTSEFQAYVKDKWAWKDQWASVSNSYTGKMYS